MEIKLFDRVIELTEEEADDLREIGRHSYGDVRRCLHASMLDDAGDSLESKGVCERVGQAPGVRLRLTLDGCDALYELTRAEVRRASQPAPAVAVEVAS